MDPDVLRLIVLFMLIVLSAFFSSAETALTSASNIKIRTLSDNGNRRAALVLKLTENPSKLLSTILIGNNIVNLGAAALTTVIFQEMFDNIPLSIGTGILTFIIIIFGEIVPKTAAALNPEKIALLYAPLIYALSAVMTPVIFVINKFSNLILFILRIDPDKKGAQITEDEFLTVVDVSHEEGVIEDKEKDMIENVVDFGDSMARDIMVPRIDVLFVSTKDTYQEISKSFMESNFSRLPVYEDTTDNVIGVLFLKDFFAYTGDEDKFDVKRLIRQPYYTFEQKHTSELLSELRQKKISIAIVLDEYGVTAGIITIEDLLEEIVGELRDEYDFDEEDMIKKISNKIFVADGAAKIDDINEVTELDLDSEEYDSIAGYIIHLFERIPEKMECVNDDKAKYLILKADKTRIDKVKIIKN